MDAHLTSELKLCPGADRRTRHSTFDSIVTAIQLAMAFDSRGCFDRLKLERPATLSRGAQVGKENVGCILYVRIKRRVSDIKQGNRHYCRTYNAKKSINIFRFHREDRNEGL